MTDENLLAAIEATDVVATAIAQAWQDIEAIYRNFGTLGKLRDSGAILDVLRFYHREDLDAALSAGVSSLDDMAQRLTRWMQRDPAGLAEELLADFYQSSALLSEIKQTVKSILALVNEYRRAEPQSPGDAVRLDEVASALAKIYAMAERAYLRHEGKTS